MIAPIDPTGRADRHANRKLIRLLGLLAGVFVVGTGIGWIVGQIGHPVSDTTTQNVATTLPASLPPTSTAVGPDALTPSAPQPASPLPQPAAATPTDQHAATSFIAEATQQPQPAAPPAPPAPVAASPVPATTTPPPAPLAPSPSAAKPEPEVVIEPAQEQASPPEAAKPAEPVAAAKPKPPTPHPTHLARVAKHRPQPHVVARHGAAGAGSRVTVIGGKGAPAGTRWTIQLGAFRTHDHAALLVMTLQSHGTVAKVIKRDAGAKGVWYVVQTPSVLSLKAATTTAAAISRRERVAASVLRAPAS